MSEIYSYINGFHPGEALAVQASLTDEIEVYGDKACLNPNGIFHIEGGKQRFWTPHLLNIRDKQANLSLISEERIDIHQISRYRRGFKAFQHRLIRSFQPEAVRLCDKKRSHEAIVVKGGLVLPRQYGLSLRGIPLTPEQLQKQIDLGLRSNFAGSKAIFTKVDPDFENERMFVVHFQPVDSESVAHSPVVVHIDKQNHQHSLVNAGSIRPFVPTSIQRYRASKRGTLIRNFSSK
ncbi:MAG: hypothetical protein PHQ59_05345 [Candidatus Daviesbacteria bacterium]|nr:hypothetical protein [Candidatus Daviesbacteria bacterium]